MAKTRYHVPVLVIGSGLAGCSAALTLADAGHEVLIISESDHLGGGNSELAQGGIIYKAATEDTAEEARALEHDILVAGHEYNYKKAVRNLCVEGPECVDHVLIERSGIEFDKDAEGNWDLTREGGHGRRRILHKADYSGKAIMDGIREKVRTHKNITILYRHTAIDLLTTHHSAPTSQMRYEVMNRCIGAYVLDENTGGIVTIIADHTVLATGGVGQVFLHSTNSPACVGSAISMASRAGVSLANLEFMQFHPTTLFSDAMARCPLITEAMRGYGGILRLPNGESFMEKYDKRLSLAPRDIVARAIDKEMKIHGIDHVCLDVTHKDPEETKHHFPNIYHKCLSLGIDITKEYIPVRPAAHYMCGGIKVDLNGESSIHRLYAIGECSCTGLHGGNRLASNSLIEAVVYADAAAKHSLQVVDNYDFNTAVPEWNDEGTLTNEERVLITQSVKEVGECMSNYVGIVRSDLRLKRAWDRLDLLYEETEDLFKHVKASRDICELRNMINVGYLITRQAIERKECRGLHYTIDYPVHAYDKKD